MAVALFEQGLNRRRVWYVISSANNQMDEKLPDHEMASLIASAESSREPEPVVERPSPPRAASVSDGGLLPGAPTANDLVWDKKVLENEANAWFVPGANVVDVFNRLMTSPRGRRLGYDNVMTIWTQAREAFRKREDLRLKAARETELAAERERVRKRGEYQARLNEALRQLPPRPPKEPWPDPADASKIIEQATFFNEVRAHVEALDETMRQWKDRNMVRAPMLDSEVVPVLQRMLKWVEK
jgi:hypothetical protein